MEFLKKLIESKTPAIVEDDMLTEQWHDVEGVSAEVGDYRISADGYFDENELYLNITNMETGEQYRAEVFKSGNQFEINVGRRGNGRQSRPLDDSELEQFLSQLALGFMHKNYDRILTPQDGFSDEYDSYENRRERMRQARDYRSEIEADY